MNFLLPSLIFTLTLSACASDWERWGDIDEKRGDHAKAALSYGHGADELFKSGDYRSGAAMSERCVQQARLAGTGVGPYTQASECLRLRAEAAATRSDRAVVQATVEEMRAFPEPAAASLYAWGGNAGVHLTHIADAASKVGLEREAWSVYAIALRTAFAQSPYVQDILQNQPESCMNQAVSSIAE